MDKTDALTTAREALEIVEGYVYQMRDALNDFRSGDDPLGEIHYWKTLTHLASSQCTKMEQALDVLISEMETIESLKGKEDDKR